MHCVPWFSHVPTYAMPISTHCCTPHRYVILPKDFEKGYKANVKKGDSEFAFYQ